ncbi:MAG: hypothetical protein DSZ12_01885 [Sulfurovum sp.]|nr:MAG: hypothetical protein DSZ12_01885 [Sulfurovum sp.]
MYLPQLHLAKRINAQQATSIDLTPTIIHLTQIKNEKNSFVGTSLFEKNRKNTGISSYGSHTYMIQHDGVIRTFKQLDREDTENLKYIEKYIQYMHELEKKDRIFPGKP